MRKTTRAEKIQQHMKRNCLLCDLEKRINNEEKFRMLKVNHADSCFALLDKNPKTLGHSLIVSRSPFDDLTDTIVGVDENEKVDMFTDAIALANRLKAMLGAEKVYVMSICEHWEMWETSNGRTSEHLHFHLVPRYSGMRNKRDAAENLLAREGKQMEDDDLERLANLINVDR